MPPDGLMSESSVQVLEPLTMLSNGAPAVCQCKNGLSPTVVGAVIDHKLLKVVTRFHVAGAEKLPAERAPELHLTVIVPVL